VGKLAIVNDFYFRFERTEQRASKHGATIVSVRVCSDDVTTTDVGGDVTDPGLTLGAP